MILWIIFGFFIILSLLLDTGVVKDGKTSKGLKFLSRYSFVTQAIIMSFFWVFIAIMFGLALYLQYGSETSMEYFSCYLLEKGALVMRLMFIFLGVKLLESFHFLIFIFGGFLVFMGISLFIESVREGKKEQKEFNELGNHPSGESEEVEKHWIINFVKNNLPFVDDHSNGSFFVWKSPKGGGILPSTNAGKRLYVTKLFLALVCVELMDCVFALDSIPAIISLTNNTMVMYTSNIFAILGLRSLFFVISGMVNKFRYLQYGLAVLLVFVGLKMLVANWIKISLGFSLMFIVAIMTLSIIFSVYFGEPNKKLKTGERVLDV